MKKVFITGANKGLGLETTKRLLKKGFFVYAVSRTVKNLLKIRSRNLKVVKFDFTRVANVRKLSPYLRKSDILINNVGKMTGKSFKRYDYQSLRDIFDVNVFSCYLLIQEFLSCRDAISYKKIINISSIAGTQGSPDIPYAMTKSAMNILGTSLSEILKKTPNVSIHTLILGPISTDMILDIDRKNLEKNTILLEKPLILPIVVNNIVFLIDNDISSKEIIISNGVVWKN